MGSSSGRSSRRGCSREVELGQADFSTDFPPRGAGKWRHGGSKADHVPRGPEPDRPVTQSSPGVARPGEGRLRVIRDDEIPPIPNVVELSLAEQPMARLRDAMGMHDNALPGRVMKSLRDFLRRRVGTHIWICDTHTHTLLLGTDSQRVMRLARLLASLLASTMLLAAKCLL